MWLAGWPSRSECGYLMNDRGEYGRPKTRSHALALRFWSVGRMLKCVFETAAQSFTVVCATHGPARVKSEPLRKLKIAERAKNRIK